MGCETPGGEVAVQQRRIIDDELRDMARYFHALRDRLRLRILVTLASDGEMTVTELARTLRVSQPLISFHLRPLRLIDLVQVRRAGRQAYCSLNLHEIERRHHELLKLLTSGARPEES